LLVVGLAGCGSGQYPVHGKVSYPDGTAVTEGMVVFESKGNDNPIMARAEIQPDGSYVMGTKQPGDGLQPGTYRVLVAPKYDPNAVDRGPRPPAIDPRFSSFSTSQLTCEVKAEDNNYPITVKRPEKSR
jgi:hypothetical protein